MHDAVQKKHDMYMKDAKEIIKTTGTDISVRKLASLVGCSTGWIQKHKGEIMS
jgi:hypothetical protein